MRNQGSQPAVSAALNTQMTRVAGEATRMLHHRTPINHSPPQMKVDSVNVCLILSLWSLSFNGITLVVKAKPKLIREMAVDRVILTIPISNQFHLVLSSLSDLSFQNACSTNPRL